MNEKKLLTRVARARISEKTYLKIQGYAERHHCGSSDVVRDALKFFLQNSATKYLTKVKKV